MSRIKLTIVVGTARTDRKSIFAARLIESMAKQSNDFDVTFVDPLEMNIPYSDGNDAGNKIPEWIEINKKTEAYFIVTPEYNHGYPGTLKKLLDNDLGNYTHKPVALAGVSSGMWGGVRVIENLLPVLRDLGMVATFRDVNFQKVQDMFDDEGNLLETSEFIKGVIDRSFKELLWMSRVLKYGREEIK